MKRKIRGTALLLMVSLIASSTACEATEKKTNELSVRTKEVTDTTVEVVFEEPEPDPDPEPSETNPSETTETTEATTAYEWEPYDFDRWVYKYMVLIDEDYSYCHLVASDGYGMMTELIEPEYGPIYLAGEYDGKLYYADNDSLNYIDMTDPEHPVTTWLAFEKTDDYVGEIYKTMTFMRMVDDTIYFTYNWAYPGEDDYGLHGMRVTDEHPKAFMISPEIGMGGTSDWAVDADNKIIYFNESLDYNQKELYKYDIETGEKELILTGMTSVKFKDHYLVCKYSEGVCLYDTETGEAVYLSEVGEPYNGLTYGLADIANGDVYFKAGNDIVKYDNGNKTVVYTSPKDDFYGFTFLTDGIIELIYYDNPGNYLVNGEIHSDLELIGDFKVQMYDGEMGYYTVANIYALQQIFF